MADGLLSHSYTRRDSGSATTPTVMWSTFSSLFKVSPIRSNILTVSPSAGGLRAKFTNCQEHPENDPGCQCYPNNPVLSIF
ncbi:hypothetical protein HOLleu_31658 [Holothuria leucospilota]|uniref:Uncharacterized protein n=1 Tax=Holothuria leucospilota TaxID=206669 RepID=A0A9Q0YQD9_HOLLE|nr:hypothetical protein HOLleu_31658 [Holothuria leucospilota]